MNARISADTNAGGQTGTIAAQVDTSAAAQVDTSAAALVDTSDSTSAQTDIEASAAGPDISNGRTVVDLQAMLGSSQGLTDETSETRNSQLAEHHHSLPPPPDDAVHTPRQSNSPTAPSSPGAALDYTPLSLGEQAANLAATPAAAVAADSYEDAYAFDAGLFYLLLFNYMEELSAWLYV